MPTYIKDYPRPQFLRKNWLCLNGQWSFAFDNGQEGQQKDWVNHFPQGHHIQVPYTYETAMSGIGDPTVHPVVWYDRTVTLPSSVSGRLLLHFEGVDYHAKVWVNGIYVGEHTGGYSRFSFDVTDAARNARELRVTVCAEDSLDQDQPRGKQRYRNENWGCWYEQTSGIWKTVWLEWVPQQYLQSVENTPDSQTQMLQLTVETVAAPMDFKTHRYALETLITLDGKHISCTRHNLDADSQILTVPICPDGSHQLQLWSPESPVLYDISYRLYRDDELVDQADSYFGLRTITIEGNQILLNGKPLYLRMILDQGYWKDSGLTPPDEQALLRDIELTFQYGYNCARKHQKIEDERYLYWCDVKGLLVWSEMAATYRFSPRAVDRFTAEWTKIVRQNKNHPCIITWVPFNESWGIDGIRDQADQQAFVNGIYHLTKALDSTRPVVTNDGWEHTISDIVTIHDYREYGHELRKNYMDPEQAILHNLSSMSWYGQLAFAQGYGYQGQPVILSEYGGIAFLSKEGWGYGNQVRDVEEFLRRFESQNQAIGEVPYFTGFCYTQLTDVQQEVNGLVDMDRRDKFPPDVIERIRKINQSTGNP